MNFCGVTPQNIPAGAGCVAKRMGRYQKLVFTQENGAQKPALVMAGGADFRPHFILQYHQKPFPFIPPYTLPATRFFIACNLAYAF